MGRGTFLITALGAAAAVMTVTWAVSVVKRNASLVDQVWGLTFVVLGWTVVVAAPSPTGRTILAACLVSVWGTRLSAYLTWRSWGHGEDWRYRALRERHQRHFAATSLVTVFLPQALAAFGVATPLYATAVPAQPPWGWLDVAGVLVWLTGFLFESIGDLQLARFRADPANRAPGRVLDTGLWRYTRHPNYFGDAVQWVGLGLIGVAAGPWWALLGPIGMTLWLWRGTGVAGTEPHLHESRGEAYARYVADTSTFVPWPPRPRFDPGPRSPGASR